MTDNEIIKALEESISFDEPYESDFTLIRTEYIKNALDLINRLKAENEEKDILFEASKMTNEILGTATESFKLQLERALKQLKTAKSEARKEFAERVKALLPYDGISPKGRFKFGRIKSLDIDNLLKEMGCGE